MGKSNISMVIFNSFLLVHQRVPLWFPKVLEPESIFSDLPIGSNDPQPGDVVTVALGLRMGHVGILTPGVMGKPVGSVDQRIWTVGNVSCGDVPSGKRLHNYMENHHFSWENQLVRLGHVQVRKLLVYQAG